MALQPAEPTSQTLEENDLNPPSPACRISKKVTSRVRPLLLFCPGALAILSLRGKVAYLQTDLYHSEILGCLQHVPE